MYLAFEKTTFDAVVVLAKFEFCSHLPNAIAKFHLFVYTGSVTEMVIDADENLLGIYFQDQRMREIFGAFQK